MPFKIGDLVTRKSHQNDIIFKILQIEKNVAYLKGVNVRLIADSNIEDLIINNIEEVDNDDEIENRLINDTRLDRNEFFYLPGKILHIDGDKEYLQRCMSLYKKMKIMAYGIVMNEKDISSNIKEYLEETKPDIVVITGHDAKLNRADEKNSIIYKNSDNFIKAVEEARKYEDSQDKLIIIAGACQSNYEELIKAGANFASSPKRINIHALDPAIIASQIALSKRSESIDLIKIIESTKYKEDGMGGIITRGTMYVGYPR